VWGVSAAPGGHACVGRSLYCPPCPPQKTWMPAGPFLQEGARRRQNRQINIF
jgi:hypothetical protein